MQQTSVYRGLKGLRAPDVDDIPVMGFYGPTGSGKTYLVASASKVPGLCPVVFICMRKTDQTLLDKKDIDPSQLVILDVVDYQRKGHIENRWDATTQVCKSLRDLKPFPFKAVILDDLHLAQAYAEAKARAKSPFHQGDSVLLDLTQQGDYRLAKDWLLPVFLDLVDVCKENGALFLFTVQERLLQIVPEGDSDPDDLKSYKTSFGLMPGLIPQIAGVTDIIGKMRLSGGKTVVDLQRNAYRDAKDGTGSLGDSISEPTVGKFVNTLAGRGWEWAKRVKLASKDSNQVSQKEVSTDGRRELKTQQLKVTKQQQ